jgi:hypothetical protein
MGSMKIRSSGQMYEYELKDILRGKRTIAGTADDYGNVYYLDKDGRKLNISYVQWDKDNNLILSNYANRNKIRRTYGKVTNRNVGRVEKA